MKHVAPPIGLAETARGILVSLPPRLGLVLSLRKTFRGVQPAAEPWTYLVPAKRARRLGEWVAEVELQALTAIRRRAWTADEAEWSGVPGAAAAAAPAAEPTIVALPKKRTARPVLELLQRMAAGEILVAEVAAGGRAYRLSPSGRAVRPGVADRAIGACLLVPSCDGLFGPDWSQTWRSPTKEELDAATDASRNYGSPNHPRRKDRRTKPLQRLAQGRPRGRTRARATVEMVADAGGREGARRGGVIA